MITLVRCELGASEILHVVCLEAMRYVNCSLNDDVYVFGCRYLQQQVKPCLQKLKTDADIDVQYYAVEALEGNFLFL